MRDEGELFGWSDSDREFCCEEGFLGQSVRDDRLNPNKTAAELKF